MENIADKRREKLMNKILLNQEIEEIKEFISDFAEKKKEWENFISGFSTDAYRYGRLIEFLTRLIELEKQEFKRS